MCAFPSQNENIGPVGYKALLQGTCNGQVKALKFSSCGVDDEKAQAIASALPRSNLEQCFRCGNPRAA